MKESRFELFDGLIASAGRALQRMKSDKMKKYGLGSAHAICLCKLGKVGKTGVTQKELTEQEGIDRAQVSRVLRDLEERQMIVTEGNTAYKKRYLLTEVGEKIAAEINAVSLEINEFVSRDIPEEEICIFYRVMEEIERNLKKAEKKFCG